MIFLVMLVMVPLGGWTSDGLTRRYGPQVGRRVVPLIGLTIGALLLYFGVSRSAVGVAAILLALAVGVAAILLALAVGFASLCEGPFWAMAIDIGGLHTGAAAGIMNTGGNVGGFLSPVLTPFVAKYFDWSWALCAGSVIVALGAVASWFVNVAAISPGDVAQHL